MGLPLPGPACEAIAAGHAVLITTSTGGSCCRPTSWPTPGRAVSLTTPRQSSPPPGSSGTSSPPPGSCPPSPRRPEANCAGAAAPCTPLTGPYWRCPRRLPTHPGLRNPPRLQAERHDPRGRRRCAAAHRVVLTQMVYTGTRYEAANTRRVGCHWRSHGQTCSAISNNARASKRSHLPRIHSTEPTARLATWPYSSQGSTQYRSK